VDQTAIFGPFFAAMLLTFTVWVYMYIRRIHWIQTRNIQPADLLAPGALAQLSPAGVNNPSDNLKNLFEIPVLFYALALYLHAVGQVDSAYVTAGWIFVGFRALHSAVHCTFNLVMLRFYLYLTSTVALFYMLFRAALAHF
ncbi:MAG: MAPEG family protein, partial [Myxococcota bacterium]